MAVLRAAARNNLPASDFAVPGKRSLPMHDKLHAQLAWRAVNRTQGLSAEERASAKRRILSRLREMGVDVSNYNENLSMSEMVLELSNEELVALSSYTEELSTKDLADVQDELGFRLSDVIPDLDEIVDFDEGLADGFIPPEGVRSAARRGLRLREKFGRGGLDTREAGRQGIGSGVARARDLASGASMPLKTVKRMRSFFARHAKNKSGSPEAGDRGAIAWLLWGGDAGKSWADGIVSRAEKADEKLSCCDGTGSCCAGTAEAGTTTQMGVKKPVEQFSASVGSMVRWGSSGGTARGKVVSIVKSGEVPGIPVKITGSEEDPAARIQLYREDGDGKLKPTDEYVGHKVSSLQALSQDVSCYFGGGAEVFLLSDGAAMLRIPIARFGTFVHPVYGTVDFTQRDFDEMVENFNSNEAGFVPYLRYGHARFPEAIDGEPKVANLEKLEQEEDVLYGVYRPLTDEVVDDVREGRYASASAELKRYAISKRDGRPIGTLLTAHALTNAPFVPDLPPNQVLSQPAGMLPVITLCMSEGDQTKMSNNKSNDQVLSDVGALLDAYELSDAQRDQLRKKLAGMVGAPADPEIKDDKPAGIPGDDPAAAKLSNDEDLSHGEPLKKAGEALKKMGREEDMEEKREREEERMSLMGEFLSSMAKLFQGQKMAKKAEAPKGEPQKYSDDAEGGVPDMFDEAKLSALVNQAVEKAKVELTQQFSEQIAAKEEVISDLSAKLSETRNQTEQYSNAIAETNFTNRVNGLVAAGIPAVTVQAVAEIARNLRGSVQKLSNGAEVDAAEALFAALETLPHGNRVEFEQIGQQLTDSASVDNQYSDIIANLLGESGK